VKPDKTMPTVDPTDFQFLAEHSVDIISRSDMDMVLTYVSPSSLPLLGYKPEEMVGKKAEVFIVAEDIPAIHAAVVRILASEVQSICGEKMGPWCGWR
jgi:PAS domain S-box-containing protein